jgi:hypothetical protein
MACMGPLGAESMEEGKCRGRLNQEGVRSNLLRERMYLHSFRI